MKLRLKSAKSGWVLAGKGDGDGRAWTSLKSHVGDGSVEGFDFTVAGDG
mgnify:CR=1 FL=1